MSASRDPLSRRTIPVTGLYRHIRPFLVLFALLCSLLLCPMTAEAADGEGDPDGTITVLDYGPARMAGDAVLLESDGHYLLMDTAYTDKEKQIGESSVILYLKAHGIDHLDLYLSHYHNDHYFLMTTIMKDPYFTVGTVYLPDASHMLKYTAKKYRKKAWYRDLTKNVHEYGTSWEKHSYTEIKNVIRSRQIPCVILKKGSSFDVGSAHCEVLWQNTTRRPSGGNAVQYINNTSLVTRVTMGDVRYLTAGDIHIEVEDEMRKAGVDLQADIVKTNHHSYNTSNKESYYKAVRAQWAFSTAGGSVRTKDAFLTTGTNYVTHNGNGEIIFTIRGDQIDMTAQKNLVTRELAYETADGSRHTRTVSFAKGMPQFVTPCMLPDGAVLLGDPGWHEENGRTYYYDENGRMVKGTIAEIDGSLYYFDAADGRLRTGWLTVGGERYYAASDGKLVTGWKELSGKVYYFHPDGHRQTGGELEVAGAHGVFDDDGVLTGITFDSTEAVLPFFSGFTTIAGDTYYYDKGTARTGLQTIDKKKYLFDAETGVMQHGLQAVGSKNYYFAADTGAARTGWITEDLPGIGLSTEGTITPVETEAAAEAPATSAAPADSTATDPASPDTAIPADAEEQAVSTPASASDGSEVPAEVPDAPVITTRTFYAGKDGVLVTGWRVISSKIYYFYPNGLMQPEGAAMIGAGRGFFLKNGVLDYIAYEKSSQVPKKFTGIVQIGTGGNTRYYYKSGRKQKGWQTVCGRRYYFNSKYKMLYGRQKINKRQYFFHQDTGVMQKGWITTKAGYRLYADSKGALKAGWQTLGGKRYFFSKSNCTMLTGKRTINRKNYFFNAETGVLVRNGWGQAADGHWYYTDKNGVTRTGWITVKGEKYYMDPRTCAMVTGFRTISKKKYYFDASDGHMVTGLYTIDDVTYEFSSAGVLLGIVETDTEGDTAQPEEDPDSLAPAADPGTDPGTEPGTGNISEPVSQPASQPAAPEEPAGTPSAPAEDPDPAPAAESGQEQTPENLNDTTTEEQTEKEPPAETTTEKQEDSGSESGASQNP